LEQGVGRKKTRGQNASGSPSGRLRIVAGKWRSRLLPIADEPGLRPTSERIRETLFNWLTPDIHGMRCLDLFAGSGALGFEALSRGAASVVFVERSPGAAKTLRVSIGTLDAGDATVVCTDAQVFLKSDIPQKFDLVFLDPPFADDLLEDLCRLLAGSGCLAAGARIYLEQERNQTVPTLPEGWTFIREKTAGNVRYSLVRAKD
jgi:16S rRNA (guanine966-N2)-methyltransferase